MKLFSARSLFAASLSLCAGPAFAQVAFDAVAIEHESVPGNPDLFVRGPFELPVINANGEVAFRGYILDMGVPAVPGSTRGIWSNVGGDLALVMRGTDTAPFHTGFDATFTRFSVEEHQLGSRTFLHDNGDVVFFTEFDFSVDSTTFPQTTHGIWSGQAGDLRLVVDQTSSNPAVGGGTFFALNPTFRLGAPGAVVFFAIYGTSVPEGLGEGFFPDGRAIFMWQEGDYTRLIGTNDAAPGIPGAFLTNSGLGGFLSNDVGQIAFAGNVMGKGITENNDNALWVGSPGDFQLVIREGDSTPGIADIVFRLRVVGGLMPQDRSCFLVIWRGKALVFQMT